MIRTRRLRHALVGVLLAALFGCGGDATPLPDLPPARADAPEPVGLSSWRRTAIDTLLDGRVWMGARSGFVALVARDGRLIHASLAGHQDLASQTPMSMETRFQIASMTKPVIATAAMILVEEGRLSLDDRVADYLPSFGVTGVARFDDAGAVVATVAQDPPMTLRHVLAFASGMGPGFEEGPLMTRWRDEGSYAWFGPLAERVERLSMLPLFEQPGTRWRYGSAYDVLARIVEIAAEQPLDVFLKRRIFDPLGMASTHYLRDTPPDAPLATMYTKAEDGELVLAEPEHVPDDWTPGGTGLVSTAPDYMRFALMLWNEGEYAGARILSREAVQRMRTPEIDGVLGTMGMEGLAFGLGVSVVTDEASTPMSTRNGDFWWGGAYGTHFWVSPSTGIVLVVMQQQYMEIGEDTPIMPFVVQQLALTD